MYIFGEASMTIAGSLQRNISVEPTGPHMFFAILILVPNLVTIVSRFCGSGTQKRKLEPLR